MTGGSELWGSGALNAARENYTSTPFPALTVNKEKAMVKKVLGINLLVFAAYALLINIRSSTADLGFNIAVGMGVCVAIQVIVNVIAGIAFFLAGKADTGKSLLVSVAILVPVGFCTWLILLSIYG